MEVGLGTLPCPVPHTLEVSLQQDSGASAHLELCAWIPSQRCREKPKGHTEPTAALWPLLGRTTWVGTGQRQTHTQARRRHTESSHSALLIGAVPGQDVWRLPWGMAAVCSNSSGRLPQLWCVVSGTDSYAQNGRPDLLETLF